MVARNKLFFSFNTSSHAVLFINDPSVTTSTTTLFSSRVISLCIFSRAVHPLPILRSTCRPLGTPADTPSFHRTSTVWPPALMGFRSECVRVGRVHQCLRFACVSATAAVCWNVFFNKFKFLIFFPTDAFFKVLFAPR